MNAKRYMYENEQGHISVTIAGANKELTALYFRLLPFDPFCDLSENTVVPIEYSGRTVHQIVNEEDFGLITDYNGITSTYYEKSFINITPTTYSLSMSNEFKEYLSGKYYVVTE